MIHFTFAQIAVITLIVLAVLALLVWSVSKVAKAAPAAMTKPGYASGVGGLLLVVAVYLWCAALMRLYTVGHEAAEVVRFAMMDAGYVWPVFQTMLPDLLSGLGFVIAALCLTIGRSKMALYAGIMLAWVAGPGISVSRAIFEQIPLTWNGEPSAMVLGSAIVTLYLLLSDRATLTYGLPKAAQLPDRA